eukprot:7493524-Pyramimonas_sp.AAC.1
MELQQSARLYYDQKGISSDLRVTNLSSAMVDTTADNPSISLKAAKSRYLLPFFVHLLESKGGEDVLNRRRAESGTHLFKCGKAMCEYINICRREPRHMSDEALAHLAHVTRVCVQSWQADNQPVAMKWHAFGRHFHEQAAWSGNPGCTANFADESENYSTKVRSFGLYRPKFCETWLTKWVMEFLMTM